MHVKKGEKVLILSGSSKGKTSTVLKVFPKTGMVVLEGINLKKRHQKTNRKTTKGSVIEKPHPIHASNVRLVDKRAPKAAKKK
jgi:large subunit ribosomal protein L24